MRFCRERMEIAAEAAVGCYPIHPSNHSFKTLIHRSSTQILLLPLHPHPPHPIPIHPFPLQSTSHFTSPHTIAPSSSSSLHRNRTEEGWLTLRRSCRRGLAIDDEIWPRSLWEAGGCRGVAVLGSGAGARRALIYLPLGLGLVLILLQLDIARY